MNDDYDPFPPGYIREAREQHLNAVLADLYPIVDQWMKEEGVMIPALISGLVLTAQKIAKDYEAMVEPDYFEKCVTDILAGRDGLNVGRFESE